MREFNANAARKLQDKIANKKLSWSFRRRFLKRLKEIVSHGNTEANFEKTNYSNWEQVIIWLEDLGYTCKQEGKTINIYWNEEDKV